MINKVLQDLHYKNVLVYVDDVLIFSRTFEEYLTHLGEVFCRLKTAHLTLKPSKCKFGIAKVNYLGHVLSREGVEVDDAKIRIVKEYPQPKNQHEVCHFLGLTTYYRKFVKDYNKITVPLNQLLHKNEEFKWTELCKNAFETLKLALTSAPILAYADMSKPFILSCNASGHAIGYILGQLDDQNRERVINYGGRALKTDEKNGQ